MEKIDMRDHAPLSTQIKNIIRRRIEGGEFSPSMRIPPEQKLAEEFEVSRMTVREAIIELVNEDLLYRRVGKGTFIAEPSSVKERVLNIGIVVYAPALQSGKFWSEIIRGMDTEGHAGNLNLVMIPFDEDTDIDADSFCLNVMKTKQLQGLVITDEQISDENIFNLKKERKSIVLMDRYSPSDSIPCINLDYSEAIFQSVDYLVKVGHEKVAYLGLEFSKYKTEREKLNSYKLALEKNGLTYDEKFVKEGDFLGSNGSVLTLELLSLSKPPTAIVTADDSLAIGAIHAIRNKGLRIPQDIAVVGFGDFFEPSIVEPKLTTIQFPRYKMGQEAIKILNSYIKDRPVENCQITLKCLLVKGESA